MPRGLLPVIELDGRVITESVVIMQLIDQTFPEVCAHVSLPRDHS